MRRLSVAVVVVACLSGMWSSARVGAARLLASGDERARTPFNELALRLSPDDPLVHYKHAKLLKSRGAHRQSAEEFERAVRLRPDDFMSWLNLGGAQIGAGDYHAALRSLRGAAERAPFYAQPRWKLGNLLLEVGTRQAAFAELRQAARSEPRLLHKTFDLAWKAFGGDAAMVREAVGPQDDHTALALADFLLQHGQSEEAVRLFRAAKELPEERRRALVAGLMKNRRFAEAYDLWAGGRAGDAGARPTAALLDGSFERRIDLAEVGFGWRVAPGDGELSASLDTHKPHAGDRSLLLVFDGHVRARSILSQTVLVEPATRYRLSFAFRTRGLVSGALPVVAVVDESGAEGQPLAESEPLPKNVEAWQAAAVEVTTPAGASAVTVRLQRQATCDAARCPIFGQLWLDGFRLEKVAPASEVARR